MKLIQRVLTTWTFFHSSSPLLSSSCRVCRPIKSLSQKNHDHHQHQQLLTPAKGSVFHHHCYNPLTCGCPGTAANFGPENVRYNLHCWNNYRKKFFSILNPMFHNMIILYVMVMHQSRKWLWSMVVRGSVDQHSLWKCEKTHHLQSLRKCFWWKL